MPTETVTDSVEMVGWDAVNVRCRRARAIVMGTVPYSRPCRARPMRKTAKFGASVATTDPTQMTLRLARRSRRVCGPSARRPMIGVATAPTSRLMVSIHCAVLTGTPNSAATDGTSSMPNELTTELVRAA